MRALQYARADKELSARHTHHDFLHQHIYLIAA
jgi:hypothetical protein